MTDYTTETLIVTSDFSTVASMVWRRFKAPMLGVVEDAYERNPGLCELGPILPLGTQFVIRVPIQTAADTQQEQEVIRLW